ncbi:MAG: MazG nucleotide pyrophosphohydrolase domain-containing protein, partial [Acidimicrobiales bacterium]
MTTGSIAGDKPRITICGLGPGGPGRMTQDTAEALAGPAPVYLRTARHPGAELVSGAVSFDHLYEAADSFEEVYRTIVDELVAAAAADGHVVYAVPGSPLVLERSVRHLRSIDEVETRLLPAVSFLDEVWARLGVDPVDDGVRLVDGLRFATDAADQRGPLLVAHVHGRWVLSDIKLALDAGPEQTAVVLQRLGTDEERVFEVAWPDLDRMIDADHLTSLYLPELAAPVGYQLARSVEMMRRLRRDCPWDRDQTHGSLRRHLIEESYEVLDAIDALAADDADEPPADHGPSPDGGQSLDRYADLEEELGDLWFQILFHAELAAEAGQFTIAEVAQGLCDKMIRRHPHVYGGEGALDGSTAENWERLKQDEKARGSALDGIPSSLPALAGAEKVLHRADGAGAPARFGDLESIVGSAVGATTTEAQFGTALLAMVELGRRRGLHAEQ